MFRETLYRQFASSRARGADFQVGGGGGGQCERVSVILLGGSGGMVPWENLKLKSSGMARNDKTAKSEVNF